MCRRFASTPQLELFNDAKAVAIGYVQGALGICRNTGNTFEASRLPNAVGMTKAESRAGQCCHFPEGRDAANGCVHMVSYIHSATGIYGHAGRVAKAGRWAWTIGAPPMADGPGQGRYATRRRDFTNGLVAIVSHIHRALGIYGHARRAVEKCRRAQTIGATLAASRAGKGCHTTRRSNFTNRVVERVGHVHHAIRIHSNAVGQIEPGSRTDTIGAALAASGAGQCGYHASRSYFSDGLIISISHV